MILGNAGSRENAFGAGSGIARMFAPVKTKEAPEAKNGRWCEAQASVYAVRGVSMISAARIAGRLSLKNATFAEKTGGCERGVSPWRSAVLFYKEHPFFCRAGR